MHERPPFSIRLLAPVLVALALGCRAPVFTPETKQQVLARLDHHVETVAYAPGVDFGTWPRVRGRHQAALEAATTAGDFAKAANEALGEYRVSHCQVLTPERSQAYHQNYSEAALGFDVVLHEGLWMVHHVEPGSPAEGGGLRAGDALLGLRTDQPLATTLEPRVVGRKVTLRWRRRDVEHTATFTMARVVLREPVSLRWLEGKVAVLRVPSFMPGRYEPDPVAALVSEARDARGLILDLRGNRGGLITHAAHLLSQFVPARTLLFRTMDRKSADPGGSGGTPYVSHPPKAGPATCPVAVLVSGINASGGELVPAVLQELGRAQVLGMKTSGAVLGAKTYPLGQRWEVQLPHLDVLPPKGRSLEGRGVAPDIALTAPRTILDEAILAEARRALGL